MPNTKKWAQSIVTALRDAGTAHQIIDTRYLDAFRACAVDTLEDCSDIGYYPNPENPDKTVIFREE